MLVREKITKIDETLPPVAQLIEGKRTKQWQFDIHGKEIQVEFGDLVDRDPYRIPLPIDREGYQTKETSHFYWSSGYLDWVNVRAAIEEFGIASPNPIRIFDMACASGRFLRHVATFGKDQFDPWGADIAHANINWMKKYLPKKIKAITNTIVPHLPYPDRFFDVVTGFSFMPHIEHLNDAWLLELCRITKPNGLLYLTIANEATWRDSVNRPTTIKHFEKSNALPGNDFQITKEAFESPLPGERLVRHVSKDPVFNCYIWDSNQYVQENWARYLKVHRIVDFGHARHQAVVLGQPNIW